MRLWRGIKGYIIQIMQGRCNVGSENEKGEKIIDKKRWRILEKLITTNLNKPGEKMMTESERESEGAN